MPNRFSYAPVNPGYDAAGEALATGITQGIGNFMAMRESTRLRKQEEKDRARQEALQRIELGLQGITDRPPETIQEFQAPGAVPVSPDLPSSLPSMRDPSGNDLFHMDPTQALEGKIPTGMVGSVGTLSSEGPIRHMGERQEQGVRELGPNPFGEGGLYLRERDDIQRTRELQDQLARLEAAREGDDADLRRALAVETIRERNRGAPTATDVATRSAAQALLGLATERGIRLDRDNPGQTSELVLEAMELYPDADINELTNIASRMSVQAPTVLRPGVMDALAGQAQTNADIQTDREIDREGREAEARKTKELNDGIASMVQMPAFGKPGAERRSIFRRIQDPSATPSARVAAINELLAKMATEINVLSQRTGVPQDSIRNRIRQSFGITSK